MSPKSAHSSKMEKRPKKMLWAPKELSENGDPIFLMDATHRGDMYHFRAAMELGVPYSAVYLYNYNKSAKQLKDYLTRSARESGKHIFVVDWDYSHTVNPGHVAMPSITKFCSLDDREDGNVGEMAEQPRRFKTYSEGIATEEIAERAKEIGSRSKSLDQDAQFTSMKNGMHILERKSKMALEAHFKKQFNDIWDKNTWTILVMYRDTGTHGGVHPELDSGIESIKDIVDIINRLPAINNQQARAVLCGNTEDILGRDQRPIPSIKNYWTKLGPTPARETARDVEAYFLKWAYGQGHYCMAVGFRSGPFDLFSFMGIPTVSIGLRNYAGERRHELLADPVFKRVNVQYDEPRQASTGFPKESKRETVKRKFKSTKREGPLLFSPFWEGRGAETGKPTNHDILYKQPPGAFSSFDKVTVEVGLRIACHRYNRCEGEWKSVLGGEGLPNVVTTSTARFFYPSNLDGRALQDEIDERRRADQEDIRQRKNNMADQEARKGLIDGIWSRSEEDWAKVASATKRSYATVAANSISGTVAPSLAAKTANVATCGISNAVRRRHKE